MSQYSSAQVLGQLKDFQRRTVDYVFQRMYLDKQPTRRFLVADEVGLGKTMVAKGVIARTIEHLENRVDRIDIVYVCSNAAIAQQNISRLNVLGKQEFALASRLTLLPTRVQGLRANRVNFVSFTPGTTFDLRSRSGIKEERSVLFRMLRSETWLVESGLLHILQGQAGIDPWKQCACDRSFDLDMGLSEEFQKNIRADSDFQARIADLCMCFREYRENVPPDENELRYVLIGELRQRLSRICLDALKPNLIILDEFQRFRNLLDKENPTAELAQALFNSEGTRVLMLSATPYKMLSLDHEAEDDHYPDFLKTLGFLFDQQHGAMETTKQEIHTFRRLLLDLDVAHPENIRKARLALQNRLGSVMCRTERVGLTTQHDAMVVEPPRPALLVPDDLHHATLIDKVSRMVEAHDVIEYWKSTPYALNFMKGYELRRNLDKLEGDELREVAHIVYEHTDQLLQRSSFENYEKIVVANARLRTLFADTLDRGLWRVLWLPPSLPSWLPSGAFADIKDATKSLVFSAWNVVPDAIAALCSYEAERRMIEGLERQDIRHSTLKDRAKPLLRFSRNSEGRLTGMPTLLLMYPSPSLAALVDPVGVALELAEESLPQLDAVLDFVEAKIQNRLASLISGVMDHGREDERWYWAATVLLDAEAFPDAINWCRKSSSWRGTNDGVETDSDTSDSSTSFLDHLKNFIDGAERKLEQELGRPPSDLARVLAEIAIAGPGVCALRSLRRVATGLAWDNHSLLNAAAHIASGFQSLFNVPESISLLRGREGGDESYWRMTLKHGMEGNLPALLDEQVHILQEYLGLIDSNSETRAFKIAQGIAESLSIRTSQLTIDELVAHPCAGRIDLNPFKVRCRFALRFGDMKDEKSEARTETVRSAFNSPFRPFILASTSVGQEGLDFHNWCHAIVHWNLPSNPVDLEQREGRIHRFKGHAVRKNVAQEFGLGVLRGDWHDGDDPWEKLFAAARKNRQGDLLTYWLFETEGGAHIERRVPLIPMSREVSHLVRLKRGLALYRLVFGQPRQEDLLTHLAEHLSSSSDITRIVADWRIDLTPPSLSE